MSISPQIFFRFAAQHYSLLRDLFYRNSGINDADLQELIFQNRNENDPAPSHVADQLVKLRIIEPAPDATASYEMTQPVKNLLGFLLQEQRLTSATVIQAYLDNLEQSREDLDIAVRESKHALVERALREIGDTLERIRQDSRANREAIINEVMAVKSNKQRRSVRERFETINWLWTRYLEPLRDLIDVRKAMDSSLDGLESMLRFGAQTFELNGALSREISRCRARFLRLRREAAADFHESLREVEPLYESLKRDSELVRGASRALERLGKDGIKSLDLVNLLSIPSRRQQEGLFSNFALESYLQGVSGYQPREAPPLVLNGDELFQNFIDPDELVDHLLADLPVEDVLEWLVSNYSAFPLGEILRAYGRIHGSSPGKTDFAPSERSYSLNNITLYAHPMRIEIER